MASRLSQIQARFQQKQMQEKEEKMLRLYESQQQRAIERVNRGSAESNTSTSSISTMQKGKVRQMFDERRQKAGIDRSYPLEPLRNTKPNNTYIYDKQNDSSSTKIVAKTTVKRSLTHIKNGKPIIDKREVIEGIYNNNNGNETYEEQIYEQDFKNAPVLNRTYRRRDLELMMDNFNLNDSIDDEQFPEIDIGEIEEPVVSPPKPAIIGRKSNQNGAVANKIGEQRVFIKNSDTAVKNFVPKKTTKPLVKKVVGQTTNSSTKTPPFENKATGVPSPSRAFTKSASETQSTMSSKIQGPQTKKVNERTPTTLRPSSKSSARAATVVNRDDLDSCKYCSRRFASDRLAVHEDICAKTAKKKRKTYDATKHRVQGTELEPYTRKSNRTANQKPTNIPNITKPSKLDVKQSSKQVVPKKNDWRRKHEEFISTIRAAKMAQDYVAKGGKLSDLPPPPPSINPDYVQCPHCGRRFNETAAERHIPKCATFSFNKPKQQSRPGAGSLSKAR